MCSLEKEASLLISEATVHCLKYLRSNREQPMSLFSYEQNKMSFVVSYLQLGFSLFTPLTYKLGVHENKHKDNDCISCLIFRYTLE